MKRTLYLLSTLLVFYGVSSCTKKLPNGGKPYYLQIDSVKLDVSPTRGTASHLITDVWVQLGAKDLGVYEYPTQIPISAEPGTYTLVIQPGIKNNGTSNDRKPYPFYLPEVIDLSLGSDQFVRHIPHFEYVPAAHVTNDDFESGNSFDTLFQRIEGTTDVFEGLRSVRMPISPGATVVSRTNNWYPIPYASLCYVELNYKCDVPFTFGMESVQSGAMIAVSKVTLFPRYSWGKVYIEFTPEIARLNTGDYRFFIRAVNPDSSTVNSIYLDNFKVLYL